MATTGESISSRRSSSAKGRRNQINAPSPSSNNQQHNHKEEANLHHSSSLRSTLSSKSYASKHTAFYTSRTNPTPSTATFHTATPLPPSNEDQDERPADEGTMARDTLGHFQQQQKQHDQTVDMDLVTALSRQYVVDAEAAGTASPSHRSRRNTASRDNSDIPEDEEPPVPHLPSSSPLPSAAHAAYPDEKHAVSAVPSVESSELTGEALGRQRTDDRRVSSDAEDDANEARFFVPTRMRYPPPKYVYAADGGVPAGAVLFALGFLLLPLWWVGAVFPRGSRQTEVVRTWRKYNALMSLLSLPLLGLFLGLGGWQAVHG